MADRASALQAHYPQTTGNSQIGPAGESTLSIGEVPNLSLLQIGAWPETLAETGAELAKLLGADTAPGPGQSVTTDKGTLLRIEPLKWWLVDGDNAAVAAAFDTSQAMTLDLSHSRSRLRLSGADAPTLLNRQLPLDLREASFPVGAVASSAIHHAGVTLWRHAYGYDLLLPRGFVQSLWELLLDGAEQFSAKVV